MVESNDPNSPNIELAISALFEFSINWEPMIVKLPISEAEKPAKWSILLESRTEFPFIVKEAVFNRRLFSLEGLSFPLNVTESGSEDRGGKETSTKPEVELRFQVNLDAAPGMFKEMILLETDRPDIPVISIPVSGEVKGSVSVDPKEVFLGIIRSKELVEKDVLVSFNGSGAKVTRVTSTLPAMKVLVVHRDGEYLVRLKYNPVRSSEEVITGTVLIQMDSPHAPEIRVPVRGLVKLDPDPNEP